MNLLPRLGRLCGEFSNHVIGWLLLLSVLLNVTQVFTRYALNDPLFWTEEMIRYTTVWLTFVGAAAASLYGDHMDMNLFLGVQSRRFQALHQAALQLLVLVFCGLVIWQGSLYCYLNGRQTSPATGVPMLYVYGAIVVGGVLLTLVAVGKCIELLTGRDVGETAA
ncbi:MAG: TRAP transporter small permease [Rhodoferax sp.]|jgi:TRAP-type C4-dicarboxylate transport system permease small subunit|nr:TRAP transporter small permease [Rhodoferax sp.]